MHRLVSDNRLQFLRLCWVWLRLNNTLARQPTKSNQRKYFKRNYCARKEETFASFCLSPEDCFWSLRAKWALFVKVTKGSCDDTPVIFHLCCLVIINKKRGQTEKMGTPSHPFSWQQRQQLFPVHTWIPDKERASCRATAGGLQATHRRLYKGTPFNSAARLLLCLWQHLSMHFFIVLLWKKKKNHKDFWRFKWNRYRITFI